MGIRKKRASPRVSGPFLRRITVLADRVDPSRYPFNISAFSHGIDIEIASNVTFFVGENGSGKSTLLEAIAENSGFNAEGGGRVTNSQSTRTSRTWRLLFASPGYPR
jgi:predicted ATPase